ncbi:unnamed protein product [Aureobasidium vineae]|uniref:Uncharacterized protein n=1 Tax=Aureobasidium vineae TaxID=2773715 RepID=A0A9N8PFD3_9PEZI|nr:unnamed protein product [Aureobasidium vineae]
MAGNAEFAHRRSASAVSSVDGALSNDGTASDSASTVPTARSTPFIGPQNRPGIPAQHHPAGVDYLSNNDDVPDDHALQVDDTAFASQMEEIQTQIRLLGTGGPGQPSNPWGRTHRYRANLTEPLRADGVNPNELHAIEADLMFAEYYYHYDPADGPFPASNTAAAIQAAASEYDDRSQYRYCHEPDVESDTESNNEAIMASYETPLRSRYQGPTSYHDFASSCFDRPARPGTFAGMAVCDPGLPVLAVPIMHSGRRFPAETIAEIRGNAHAHSHTRAASASPTIIPNETDVNLAAVVRTIQARPASASAMALSQELGADVVSANTDTPAESPVFPANWITHTRTSGIPSLQQPVTPSRATSRRHNIHYTTSPVSHHYTEDDDDDDDDV